MGANLRLRLLELGYVHIAAITRESTHEALRAALADADIVFHLAGVNRTRDEGDFAKGNTGFTERLAQALVDTDRAVPVVFASSTQAAVGNAYGSSKRAAEDALIRYSNTSGAPLHVFRLTNVFGKWARPNYNSAVATFCHQVAHRQPITIHDGTTPLRLVYIDDVVTAFVDRLVCPTTLPGPSGFAEAGPVYEITVGELASTLQGYAASRTNLVGPRTGSGLSRALYATYVSYLPPEDFTYKVPRYADPRGEFVEMIKTPDCGQFSYFTAHAGVTRGGHYHHSKVEKFLVIKGTARFGFRHVISGQLREFVTQGGEGCIVESVPGWTHDITNVGQDELVVMLWASEIFDRTRPDTVAQEVRP